MNPQELFSNKNLIAAIEKAETVEELESVLAHNGLEGLTDQLKVLNPQQEELSEDALEAVSGGANNFIAWLGQVWYRIKNKKKATCNYSPINGMTCIEK